MQFLMSMLLAAAAVQAHYTFPRVVINGQPEQQDWYVTRMTKNVQSKMGVTNSQDAQSIATVPAGAIVHYISSQQVNHPGPTQYYLAKVPEGMSAATWDGSGSVWFKFHTEMPSMNNGQMTWPGQNEYVTVNATIPESTPSGEYLLRVEQIALHLAAQANGAQFYLSCSQINITGGGDGTPGPLVALPGAYKSTDPGILVNLNTLQPDAYIPPGPAVWTG